LFPKVVFVVHIRVVCVATCLRRLEKRN